MADITEKEAFAALINALCTGRDSCRAIGLARSDERWIQVAGIFDHLKDNATVLFTKPRSVSLEDMLKNAKIIGKH